MKYIALTALAAAIGLSSQAQAADYKAGKDYTVIENPEQINGDIIVVREFFWYGCPHCYRLEPHMQKWAQTKAGDVAFFHTPAAFNPVWEASARGFYSAQLMGYQKQTHSKLFNAIFEENNAALIGKSKDSLINWYASQGLDKGTFTGLYDSFAVNTKIARSNAAAQRYQITGTPSVVVHGKYIVQGETAEVPKVVDFLVDKVRAEIK